MRGFSYRGPHRYFLTFCTFERRPYFRSSEAAEIVVRHVRRTAIAQRFAVLAYCLMPDHVHLLVEGTHQDSDLQKFVKIAKQSSGQMYAAWMENRLWNEGYLDRVLGQDTDVREVARYIIWNPVRAGLVATPAEYPHLGSDLLPREELAG
jgi:putative transposase